MIVFFIRHLESIPGKVFGIRLRPQGHKAVSSNWNADEGNVYALQSITFPSETKLESKKSSTPSSSSSAWWIGEKISDLLLSLGFTVETPEGVPVGGINNHFWPCKSGSNSALPIDHL